MNRENTYLLRISFSVLLLFFSSIKLFSQVVSYEIYALKFGERTHKVAVSEIAVGSKSNDSVNVAFMYWLVKGSNGKLILVDAGFTEDADINPKLITYSRPDGMLEKLKIKPDSITDIIITHPHWDHTGGIDLFPNATVWMQKEDYKYFVGDAWQKEGNKMGFNKKDVPKIVQRNLDGKLNLLSGDDIEIFPGIKVFTGSKHTYESQFVCIDTGTETIIIASDNSWYYYNVTHSFPIPVTHDSKAYVTNLKRMKSMVKNIDFIIPGHDPLVFSKFPTVAEDVVKIK
jgi:glyoxylase-like metal-dependent hydrolase (beta-lactamase superfamily II)